MRPVVGISQCLDDRGRWREGRDYAYVDVAYARAVEEAGGIPLHLPVQGDPAALTERLDALLIPGGDDFLPTPPSAPYPAHIAFDPAPLAQIDFDERLLASALAREIPVLGICYGMQLLALHRGGSLHYDLPTDRPEAASHQLPEPDGRHALAVEPGTRFVAIVGGSPAPVNSLHHQAVAEPGAGLRVAARSPDGIIEVIETERGSFALGVQWHPEKLTGAARLVLFEALVEAAR